MPFLLMALATPVVFHCAQPIFRLVWRGVLNRTMRMEALLGLGIGVAYAYSCVQACTGGSHVFFDTASGIVSAVLAGKVIERNAKGRAARWITVLHRVLPNKVRLLAGGQERFVSVAALEPGEVFVVKAGERIAADGRVVDGESHADEALLTGESAPVARHPGDQVAAGSVNLDSVLHVQATRKAGDSALARIIALVNQALTSRLSLERTADRVARIFVPCVMVLASLTFAFYYFPGGAGLSVALMRAITVLNIACPCALGLATPLAITAAMGSAARAGILVGDSRVLETLGKVDTVILDKIGTVTEGKFSLLDVEPASKTPDEPPPGHRPRAIKLSCCWLHLNSTPSIRWVARWWSLSGRKTPRSSKRPMCPFTKDRALPAWLTSARFSWAIAVWPQAWISGWMTFSMPVPLNGSRRAKRSRSSVGTDAQRGCWLSATNCGRNRRGWWPN